MTKNEYRKKVIDLYQFSSGDYLDKDDYQYQPILNKIDSMFKQGLDVVEASEKLDEFISNMWCLVQIEKVGGGVTWKGKKKSINKFKCFLTLY